jgi:hypothetical protein
MVVDRSSGKRPPIGVDLLIGCLVLLTRSLLIPLSQLGTGVDIRELFNQLLGTQTYTYQPHMPISSKGSYLHTGVCVPVPAAYAYYDMYRPRFP